MKNVFLLVVTVFAAFACTTVKDSEDYRQLAARTASLEEQIRDREKEVEEVTASIGKIDSNLMKISEHVEIMDGVKLREMVKKPGEIDLMITEIGDYVKQNNEMIATLEKKVSESKTINSGLKTMIAMKNTQVEEKEKQIQELLSTIEKMQQDFHGQLASRDSTIARVRNEINQTQVQLEHTQEDVRIKEEELNTGFVTFGSKQELAQKGVIQSGGKVILSNQLEAEDFTPVDIKSTNEVKIGVTKRQKLVTSHPTDSYYFIKTDGSTYLKIVEQEKFWSVSKYLVVLTEN
ncbi:Cbp1 family collagen-binding glycoprotein adhesin [Xanthocytophaga flava]|uniref:Cbp1 family collagen-binding glycoprotein adhesin n=1 Tax=Xanthocytophaga flava TaxID=3048013 RepID=UPI0028D0A6DD|nr:hypothetical protein [Xanthocytophaga flavus]MDJ1471771.1 hypothetical protein [Xanthocytophaga flavus]